MAQVASLLFRAVMQQRDAASEVIEYQQRARRHIVQRRHAALAAGAQAAGARRSARCRRPHSPPARPPAGHPRSAAPAAAHAPSASRRPASSSRRRRRNRAQLRAPMCKPSPIEPHLEAIAEADEGVARQALAALHALEQEARGERGELHERRDRRVEISRDVEYLVHETKKTHSGVLRSGSWWRCVFSRVSRDLAAASTSRGPLLRRSAPPPLGTDVLLRHGAERITG